MTQYEAKNVTSIHADFLEVNTQDERYKNVRFVMADPSCSGSGMLNNYFFEKKAKKDSERLKKLS
jgi:16S rRNA C967 or C1407 C5-methylase (RsmB/RsmF family)